MQFSQDNPDKWTLQSDDSTSFRPWSDDDEDDAFSSWTELQRSRRRWFLSGTKSRTVSSWAFLTLYRGKDANCAVLWQQTFCSESWFIFCCRIYLSRQIPDSHSIAEDTFWCRFLIHILLQKIPCLSSESEDSPLHLTGSLPPQKAKATGQGDEPSLNDWVLKHNQGMHNLQVGATQLLWRWMRQWVLAVKQCHMMINPSDLQTKLKNEKKTSQVRSSVIKGLAPPLYTTGVSISTLQRWPEKGESTIASKSQYLFPYIRALHCIPT